MASKEHHSEGASCVETFLSRAKLTLAVAIIKTKPAGLSGREHAEALACRLKSGDESWKEKAQQLQQEVLRLRQEVLMSRVMTNTKSSAEAAGPDDTMDASQDLFGPGSEEPPDPSCGSETPDLLLEQDPPPTIMFPPTPVPSRHDGSPRGNAMLPHTQFLQSLCSLHRVEANHRGLESLWFSPDGGAGSVLVDSVCQLLDSVVSVCRDPPRLGPGDPVLQGCRVAARAMELFCSQRLPSVEFRRRVEECLRELTEMLLNGDQLGGLQAAERLMEYLMVLGSCSMSKSFLIRHILSLISALADQLWQAFQTSGLDLFPVDQYQNSCYLFWVVEALLQTVEVPVEVEQTGFLTHLDQRFFQLSEEFPLFFINMWRLGRLLTSSDRSNIQR